MRTTGGVWPVGRWWCCVDGGGQKWPEMELVVVVVNVMTGEVGEAVEGVGVVAWRPSNTC